MKKLNALIFFLAIFEVYAIFCKNCPELFFPFEKKVCFKFNKEIKSKESSDL